MKRFAFLAFVCAAVFVSCNKDEEILVDIPDDSGSSTSTQFSVIEYLPAPGQFINEASAGFNGFKTMDEACAYAQSRLDRNLFVSLGAWGGYIIVKSAAPIRNSGDYDFSIYGNSFDTSNEPGIVWVMQDTNGNGLADDEWYELKGSYYGMEGFKRNFWVTYYRPEPKQDLRWEDSEGNTGYLKWVGVYHSQDSYYPSWINRDSYTLRGTRLPDLSYLDEATGQWVNPPFSWGYADNAGEDSSIVEVNGIRLQKNSFRISDAVDSNGVPVSLGSIDFIKVQTAVMGGSEVLGENSTEVCGFALE